MSINIQRSLRTRKLVSFLSLVLLLLAVPTTLFFINHQTHAASAAGGAPPTIGGCQIFPSDNVYNYDITNLPLHPNSANYINFFANTYLHAYFSTPETGPTDLHYDGIPYIVVPSSQPMVPIHLTTWASQSDAGPYPIPANMPVEEPYDTTSDNDRHGNVIQSGTCKAYELYRAYPNADGSWTAEGGEIWDLRSNALRPQWKAAVSATGLPLFAGLVKYDEVASGQITHMLRFLLPYTQRAHIWPAIAHDGGTDDPNAPPEGLRLRLKASVDVAAFPPQTRVILTALQHYGMILDDQYGSGNTVQLSGAPDSRWDLTDLASLGKIHFSDFEAVDESGLMVDPNSGQVAGVAASTPTSVPTTITPTFTPSPTFTPTPTFTPAPTLTPTPIPILNPIQNGSFENTGSNWLAPWGFRSGGKAVINQTSQTKAAGVYSARVNIRNSSFADSAVRLYQGNLSLTQGRVYTLAFWAKASALRSIRPDVRDGACPWIPYFSHPVALTTSWHQYTLTFTAPHTDAHGLLEFNLGKATGYVWIDNVSFRQG